MVFEKAILSNLIFFRSNVIPGHPKRRPAGDGMDAPQMDDPEIMYEMTEHLGDCQCACDHVVYSPSYTNCLQVNIYGNFIRLCFEFHYM